MRSFLSWALSSESKICHNICVVCSMISSSDIRGSTEVNQGCGRCVAFVTGLHSTVQSFRKDFVKMAGCTEPFTAACEVSSSPMADSGVFAFCTLALSSVTLKKRISRSTTKSAFYATQFKWGHPKSVRICGRYRSCGPECQFVMGIEPLQWSKE